jgi:hypothetical protein
VDADRRRVRSFGYDLAQESAELAKLIRTLTVCEPPAFTVARGHPVVEWLIERLAPVLTEEASLTPDAFDAQFGAAIGTAHEPTPPASGLRLKNLDAARVEQSAWLANIALDTLAAAPFPKLVISGGWDGGHRCPVAPLRTRVRRCLQLSARSTARFVEGCARRSELTFRSVF